MALSYDNNDHENDDNAKDRLNECDDDDNDDDDDDDDDIYIMMSVCLFVCNEKSSLPFGFHGFSR